MRSFPDYGRYPASIAGEPLSNRAWFCVNPEALLSDPDSDGRNVSIPGRAGTIGVPHTDAEQILNLDFEMTGYVDPDGTPYVDPEAGLAANKKLFRAAYFRATRDAFWCVAAAIVDLDGETFVGPVQPLRPVFGRGLTMCGLTMQVKVPRGALVSDGSSS